MTRILGTLVSALLGALAAASSAGAADLKLLSSWNRAEWPAYAVVHYYVQLVHERGNGLVKIDIKGPETVPPFQQLQPVSSGAFDMLYSHGVYHAGSKGIALAVDAVELDPYKRREYGIVDFVDAYYQKHHNLKVVAIITNSLSGYHMFLRAPPSPEGEIKGRKIRGTASYHGVIKALGGTPVVLPTGEIYSALEKGVVDGSCMPAGGMLTMKHYEVAKFAVRPTFGSTNTPIFVNLDRWKKLAKAEQDLLLDAGKQHEFRMPWIGQEILAKEEAELKKLGVTYVSLPADKAALVKKTWNESIWELAKTCCADGADEFRALAKKHGMTD
jgi:TRAP-type C4-dicarboxylate transport system substrate-binding protein